jgi:hypothetical protein
MQSDCINGSPACSAPTKTQETRAASFVSSSEDILIRTQANAPQRDALLHGRVRLCRSCGCETTSGDGICRDCADAMREERAAALAERCRIHRVRYVEDLPVSVLQEMQAEWGRR